MTSYHLYDQEQPLGPYYPEQLVSMWSKGTLTANALYFDDATQTWLPLAGLMASLTAPGVVVMPPPVQTPAPATVIVHSHLSPVALPYGSLFTASWILLVLVCLVALVPFLGFTAWVLGVPVLLITLVLSLVILSRGGTVKGLCILGCTLVGAPLFIACAPLLTSALTIAAAASSARDRSPASVQTRHDDETASPDLNDAPIPSAAGTDRNRSPTPPPRADHEPTPADRRAGATVYVQTTPPAISSEPAAPTPRRQPDKIWDRPHVYLQIASEAQRPAATALRQRLLHAGYEVEGIENTAGNPHVPTEASELRYFALRDAAEATRIAREISPAFASGGIRADLPEGMPYVSHARQYEIWYSSAFFVSPPRADSQVPATLGYSTAPALIDTPAPPRAVAVASLPPVVAPTPAPAPTGPPLESLPELSPERAVTDVLTPNQDATVANFRARYSGHTVRYTGTVVRKNPKEQLLVFRGGGFLTSAYDVQASLGVDASPGFRDIAVGERITVVAVIDRLVPPPFGVGSNSIRLTDARVYRRGR